MLDLKKLFYLFIFLVSVSFVSGGVSINPIQVESGDFININIALNNYDSVIHFYDIAENLIYAIDLGCNDSCSESAAISYSLHPDIFGSGFYKVAVYSNDENKWIFDSFEVVVTKCSDGTLIGQCSSDLRYCEDTGELRDINCIVCGCSSGYECSSGGECIIDIPIGPNKKIESLYSDKKVFLASNKDWKEFLPFVSVTTWTGNENCKKGYGTPSDVCVYPTFVYHEELHYGLFRFDIDSIIDFMQKYYPTEVAIIGETPSELDNLLVASPSFGVGLDLDQINRINTSDYLFYWESFDKVVYVEDDYELALLASTYSSLINAPLIIQGTLYDSSEVLFGREIICVGDVVPSDGVCNEKYSLIELRKKYKESTNTDKVILVNPTDWENYYYDGFYASKSDWFYELYSKTSLMSPILASSKHELLLSTMKTDYLEIDEFLESELQGINYLTIMGSTYVIPHKKDRNTIMGNILGYEFGWALDASHYADITGDNDPDMAVGRIAGVSSSDISSYVARSLFYNSFSKTDNVKFMASSFGGILAQYVHAAVNVFLQTDYNVKESTTDIESFDFSSIEWENQDLIFYVDHGNYNWAGIYSYNIPALDNSLVFVAACLTVSTYESYSFWARAIRKGAIGYIGATSTTALNFNYFELLNKVYRDDFPTIGDAFKEGYSSGDMVAMTTLIGDPTFDINPSYRIKDDVSSDLCSVIGYPCLGNDWCCNGLECSWFVCEDCKLDDVFCLKDGDCCVDECKMLECGLRNNGELCVFDNDCVSDRCSFFTCKDCKDDDNGCLLDGECCDGGCNVFECGLRDNGESCVFDSDCVSDRCSFFECKSCNVDDLCLADRDCCNDCDFDTTSVANCCCTGSIFELNLWCGCSISKCGSWTLYGPLSHCDG